MYDAIVQHIVIRRESYVAGTRDCPEVGIFTQTHARRRPVPWGRVAVNDTVWMKWHGGPIVARASVKAFRQLDSCTPGQLGAATSGYKLHDLPDYWLSLPPSFRAVVIYLKNEEWLETSMEPEARSYGESWVVLDRPTVLESWLRTVPLPSPQHEAMPIAGSRRIRPSLRFEILRRDGFCCQYCGRKAPDVVLHVDHRHPRSAGGLNTVDNLVTACRDCNLGKGIRRVADSPTPYLTRSGGAPIMGTRRYM